TYCNVLISIRVIYGRISTFIATKPSEINTLSLRRSSDLRHGSHLDRSRDDQGRDQRGDLHLLRDLPASGGTDFDGQIPQEMQVRSEEHTSELQSHLKLV